MSPAEPHIPLLGGINAPIPIGDAVRVSVLESFGVLDSAPQAKFDELARLAAVICDVPMAFVSLVDLDREFFLASVGTDLTESPRDISFCGHAILGQEMFIIPDAREDPRFAMNPNVLGGPKVRFYAGVPLFSSEGSALGALCVKDTVSRELTRAQVDALKVLARQVEAQLELHRQLARSRRDANDLRASREFYRVMVEGSPDLVSLFELDGTVRIASESHAALLGYTPAELVGRPITILTDPAEVEAIFELVSAALSGAELPARRVRLRRKDGTFLVAETRFVLIEGLDTDAPCVLATSRDLTNRVSLEEKYRQSERMETIGQLTGSIVHDFNNLLVPMLGYAGLALSQVGTEQPELRAQLEQIRGAAEQARVLVMKLLAASRPQATDPVPLSLDRVVVTALPLVEMLLGRSVTVEHRSTPDLPFCVADPATLNQVLLNLAANTRDALTPTGGRVTITTSTRVLANREVDGIQLPGGLHVTLAFADDGPGIDIATQARIFEPFFTTKSEYGTGLGLATVQRIVREVGGTVELESAPGAGCTFTISLPACV